MKKQTIVLAIGGNALGQGSYQAQQKVLRKSLSAVVPFLNKYRFLITHGNGPQVGSEMIKGELAKSRIPQLPLYVLDAYTQGGLGLMIQMTLNELLFQQHRSKGIAVVITRVLVDRNDPAFKKPTKFVGPFYTASVAKRLTQEYAWVIRQDSNRGYRRVVPSPFPKQILEKDAIQRLLKERFVVVCVGGGGVPVTRDPSGKIIGIDAVIDKDLASAQLGIEIGAEKLIIVTGVKKVALNYGTPRQEFLDHLTTSDAKRYLKAGQFPPGNMGPKIQAALHFLKHGGKEVVIGSTTDLGELLKGKAGTKVS